MKIKKALGLVLIALAIVVGIVYVASINSPSHKMEKALNSKSAQSVNVLYNDALGNDSKIQKYDKVISNYLDEIFDSINEKEYSYDEIKNSADDIVYKELQNDWGNLIYSNSENEYDNTIHSSVSSVNQSRWDEIINLISSKSSYCKGVYYRENEKNPETSIQYFNRVANIDNYYNTLDDEYSKCIDLYVQQTLSEAQELIDNDDISGAISKINSINTYLENNGLTSDEIQEKLIEVKNKYAEKYVKKAENCFKEKDVNGAIGNIEIAIELAPNNSDYKSKKDTYEMYLPYYLYINENCLSVEDEGDFWGTLSFDKTYTSNNNKEMTHCIKWYNNSSDATVSIVANYNLSGNYDVVSGKIFLPIQDKDTSFFGYFKVYGDGKLLYTSPQVTKNVLPQDIKFTVTGVQRLKINFYGQGTGGFLSTSPDFCVSNLTAQKNFPNEK